MRRTLPRHAALAALAIALAALASPASATPPEPPSCTAFDAAQAACGTSEEAIAAERGRRRELTERHLLDAACMNGLSSLKAAARRVCPKVKITLPVAATPPLCKSLAQSMRACAEDMRKDMQEGFREQNRAREASWALRSEVGPLEDACAAELAEAPAQWGPMCPSVQFEAPLPRPCRVYLRAFEGCALTLPRGPQMKMLDGAETVRARLSAMSDPEAVASTCRALIDGGREPIRELCPAATFD